MNRQFASVLQLSLLFALALMSYFIIFPWLQIAHEITFIILGIGIYTWALIMRSRPSNDKNLILDDMLSGNYLNAHSAGETEQGQKLNVLMDKQRKFYADIYGMSLTASTHGRYIEEDTKRIRTLSSEVVLAIGEVAKGNTHVAQLIEGATEQTGKVNQFIHEIESDVLEISKHAGQAEQLAMDGQKSLLKQKEAVNQTLDTFTEIKRVVGSLKNAAEEIGSIAGTISSIASATNLLALNAAIEAARAGDAGRGFAVVADEIRKLAGNTNSATIQVGNLIEKVRKEVTDIVIVVGEGFEQANVQANTIESGAVVFHNIAESVVATARELDGISDKSRELVQFSESIHHAIESIAAVSQETAAGAEEVSASMEDQASAIELVNERLMEYGAKASEIMGKLSGIQYIRMSRTEYEEHVLQVEILKQVLKDKMGIAVEGISVPIEELFRSVAVGATDGTIAPWMPSGQKGYDQFKDKLVSLGPNMKGCLTGIAVPEYVSATRIEDLKGKESQFDGILYSCYRTTPLGHNATEAVQLYGLNLKLEYCNEGQMISALKKRYAKKEWVAITGWQPHHMMDEYNLKFLSDSKVVFGKENHCETFINKGLETQHPQLIEFLKSFKLDVKGINEALGHVGKGMTMENAAIGYISTYWHKG